MRGCLRHYAEIVTRCLSSGLGVERCRAMIAAHHAQRRPADDFIELTAPRSHVVMSEYDSTLCSHNVEAADARIDSGRLIHFRWLAMMP